MFEGLGRIIRAALGGSTDNPDANKGFGCVAVTIIAVIVGIFMLVLFGILIEMLAAPMAPMEFDD